MAIAMRRGGGGAVTSPDGEPVVEPSVLRGPGSPRLAGGAPAFGCPVTGALTAVLGDPVGGSCGDVAVHATRRQA